MAKLTKQRLKAVVKECLVEILEDGILSDGYRRESTLTEARGNQYAQQRMSSRRSVDVDGYASSQVRNDRPSRRPALDNIRHGSSEQEDRASHHNDRFNKAVQQTVSGITDDPIMSEIFSDTARSTLQEQSEGNARNGPSIMEQGDAAARQSMKSDPMSIFGEASQNWATLAFADKKTPGM